MKSELFKIKCITNLHVGSGDVNYNIVDKEVEKDPVTEYPVINASGVKGAFRDSAAGMAPSDIERIFGAQGANNEGKPGLYKFFDAKFLSRPLRVGGKPNMAYIPVTTVTAVNDFLREISLFKCNPFGIEKIREVEFSEDFLVSCKVPNIEGSTKMKLITNEFTEDGMKVLKKIFGENFAIAKDINEYSLPVVARNKVHEDKNLWYEEFVPHHSMFYLIVLVPDKFELDISEPVQFGGNASVGYGFTAIDRF